VAHKNLEWYPSELEMFQIFFDLMVKKVAKLVQDGLLTMKTQLLGQINQIALYLKVNDKYAEYIKSYALYS
jgi:hypothetical protein